MAAVFALVSYGGPPQEINSASCPVTISYVFYDVTGTTVEQLRKAMLENGPVDTFDNKHYAYTAWSINWTWPQSAAGKNDFSMTEVSCSAVMTLPRFKPLKGTPFSLLLEWNSFFERLVEHENNHIENAVKSAPSISNLIRQEAQRGLIRSAKDANAIGYSKLREIRQLDLDYDQRTHYGQTEGTWLVGSD